MNIVVCVKQVPDTSEVKLDKKTNTIIREGVESIINPYDAYALEEGVRLKEKLGGRVSLLSMGIPAVRGMLKEAIAAGADEAFLLSDRRFAGADSLATAYSLYLGVNKIEDYDLIICGKQAIDGDTAQVGPSLAQKLGIPHVSYVISILEASAKKLKVKRLVDDAYEIIEVELPALITVEKGINIPRFPSIEGFFRSEAEEVTIWGADDVKADMKHIGLEGSATWVLRTFAPSYEKSVNMIGGSPKEQAREAIAALVDAGFIESGREGE